MGKILLNGSPRGDKSNSMVMLKWFNEGYGEELPIYKLHLESYHSEAKKAFLEAEEIFIVMPVYCDSMPAQVMKFFESLEGHKNEIRGKRISALIHLGFPEGAQAYPLKKILEAVFLELELECKGIVIKGDSEGTRLKPESWQRKTIQAVQAMGVSFREGVPFSEEAITYLGSPMVLSSSQKFLMRLGDKLGFSHLYWNKQLKDNGVLEKSFDHPYA